MFQNLPVSEKAIGKYLFKYTGVLGNKISVMFTLGAGSLSTLKSSCYQKNSIVLNVHILKAWPWKLSPWSNIYIRLRIRVMYGRSEDRSLNWTLLWFWYFEICSDHQLLLQVNKSNPGMDEQSRKTTTKKWNIVEKVSGTYK